MPVAATFAVADPAVLKKLSPAVIADAATSEVPASFLIASFSAVLKFVAVVTGLGGTGGVVVPVSIAKLPAGTGLAVVAVRSICSVVPSGRVNWTLNLSPSLGGVAAESSENATGEPAGPVSVAPVSVEEAAEIFSPNGDVALSSITFTEV